MKMELLKTYRFINSHLECEGEIEMEAQEKKENSLSIKQSGS